MVALLLSQSVWTVAIMVVALVAVMIFIFFYLRPPY
jgi:hypothetical protein